MQLWKQSAASLILMLGAINSMVRGIANFTRMFEQASELSALEQAIEDRKALKDMAIKFEMTDADIEAIRQQTTGYHSSDLSAKPSK
jgi:hypothetical protein